MAKRIIALFLALLMTGSVFACGADEQGSDDTTPTDGETTAPVTDENKPKSGVPDGTTFGGATVRIMNGQYFERYLNLVNASESNGDTVNDAVYKRNLAVMDKLQVKFEYTDIAQGWTMEPQTIAKVQTSVLAGDQDWDIIHDIEYYMSRMPNYDIVYNLADAPYIDIEQPWWSTDYIRKANFNDDNIFFITGDISIGHINQISALYYNKALYEEYYGDPDELYDIVLDGKWTMDKFYELVAGVWEDENGDNKIDFDDVVGLARAAGNYANYHHFHSAGGTYISYDENGVPFLDGIKEINTDLTEKIYKLVFENPGVCNKIPEHNESDFIMEKKFAEGTAMFMTNLICGADHLRDMKDSYGIIPYPKLNEDSGDYATLVHNQSASYAIPKVTSTSDMACAVLEELAYQGYMTMVPEYYSVALKTKYMRDSDSDKAMQILDMLRDSATTDMAFVYCDTLSQIGWAAHDCIVLGHSNFVSRYEERYSAANETLKKMVEKYCG